MAEMRDRGLQYRFHLGWQYESNTGLAKTVGIDDQKGPTFAGRLSSTKGYKMAIDGYGMPWYIMFLIRGLTTKNPSIFI